MHRNSPSQRTPRQCCVTWIRPEIFKTCLWVIFNLWGHQCLFFNGYLCGNIWSTTGDTHSCCGTHLDASQAVETRLSINSEWMSIYSTTLHFSLDVTFARALSTPASGFPCASHSRYKVVEKHVARNFNSAKIWNVLHKSLRTNQLGFLKVRNKHARRKEMGKFINVWPIAFVYTQTPAWLTMYHLTWWDLFMEKCIFSLHLF